MQKKLLVTALGSLCALPALAADAPASPHTFKANVALVSDYVFRGLTQTNGKPAIQGGIDYSHQSGFYAGTWMSNISWFTDQNFGTRSAPITLASPNPASGKFNQASLEWDLYAGFKNNITDDWSYDLGVLRYEYPGTYDNLTTYAKPNTTEVYGALAYKWATLKYSKVVSPTTFGVRDSRGADYVDLSGAWPLGGSGVSLQAHAGHQRYPSDANTVYWTNSGCNNSCYTYSDYKLGVTKDYAGYTFGLAWTTTNAKDAAPDNQTTAYMNAFGKNIGKDHWVVSVSRAF